MDENLTTHGSSRGSSAARDILLDANAEDEQLFRAALAPIRDPPFELKAERPEIRRAGNLPSGP